MFWPGQAGAAENSRWCFLAVAIPLWLFLVRLRPTSVHWLLGALLLYAALSLSWTPVRYDGIESLFELTLTVAMFCIAAEIDDPSYLYLGLGIGLALGTGFVLLQYGGMQPVIMQRPDSLPPGLFVNPSLLGEATAPLLMVFIARRQWLLALLILPSLVISENRSGIIACSFLVLVMLVMWRPWLAAVIAAVVVPLLVLHLNKGMHPWDSIEQRVDIWEGAWEGRSFFGQGIGSFYSMFALFSQALQNSAAPGDNWQLTSHAHNDALEYFFELGIPGIILIGIGAVAIFRSAAIPERYGLAAIGITSLVGFPFHEPFTAAVAAMLAGIAANSGRVVRRNELHGGSAIHIRGQQSEPGIVGASG